jgi:hypothetical protein
MQRPEVARARAAVEESKRQVGRGTLAAAASTAAVRDSVAARLRATSLRSSNGLVQSFRLNGMVGDRQVTARWSRRAGLACNPALRTQAQLLVDLGEIFESPAVDLFLPASLTESGEAVLLTLVRSCDRVVEVDANLLPAS